MTAAHIRLASIISVVPPLLLTLTVQAAAQQPSPAPSVPAPTGSPPAYSNAAAEAAPAPSAPPEHATAEPRKIILTSAPPPAPQGRDFHYHDGFYLRTTLSLGRFGGGLSLGQDDDQRDIDADGNGLDVSLLVGGTPSPGLAVGGGLLLGSLMRPDFEEDGDALATRNVALLLVGPFVDGFPKANAGWHLGGMLGLGGLGETSVSDASAGFGGAAWVGYDTWVGADWSLGGLLRFTALVAQGDEPAEHSASMLGVSIGLSVLYH